MVTFENLTGLAAPKPLTVGVPQFWGAPSVVDRLVYGIDGMLFEEILKSGKWTGDAPGFSADKGLLCSQNG